MEDRDDSIRRLERDELFSEEYGQFIGPLFAGDDLDRRRRFMQWLFVDNPAQSPGEKLPIYVYTVDGKLAAQLGIIPVEILFQGKRVKAGWCIDLFKNRLARRHSVGAPLLRAAYEDFPVLLSLGQTIQAYNLLCKNGFRDAGQLTHYRTLLHRFRTVPRLLMRKMARGKSQAAAATTPRSPRSSRRMKAVEELTSFDACPLPEPQSTGNTFCVCHSSHYLTWRYLEAPFASYRCLKIPQGDVRCMIAVLRFQQQDGWLKAKLVDALYDAATSPAQLKDALRQIRAFAEACGAQQLECRTSDPALLTALASRAFSTTAAGENFLFGASTAVETPEVPIERWKLYAGDCDLDMLEAFQGAQPCLTS